jgi:diguanylate cyclase (GGDEF)-like protein
MSNTTAPATVLVADDDPTMRLLVAETLMQAGLDVISAEDGFEALAMFEDAHPDLLWLDVDMPGKSGFEVCAHIRRLDSAHNGHVPIIMVTGMDDLDSVSRAYESGATDFIAKPINLPSLGHRVRYILRSSATTHDLRVAEARNRAMLSALPDVMIRLNAAGRVLAPLQGRGVLRFSPLRDCVGKHVHDLVPADIADLLVAQVQRCRKTGDMQAAEFALPLADRVCHYETRSVLTDLDEVLLFLRDISERKEADAKIRHLAYCDSLTGLPNRQAFLETLGRELKRSETADRGLAVLFLDLDGFKRINDTLGHCVGDHLLQAVAERLKESMRPRDLIARANCEENMARLGGDEFTVLVPEINRVDDALTVAHRIKDSLKRPFVIDSNEIVISASIGMSFFPDDGRDTLSLLKYADTAMYHAKERGRNNCQLYSASLTTKVMQRVSLENSLRKALQRNEFTVYYQPQVGSPDGRIVAMEALIRWNHPERGLVMPGEFIAMAEETGFIVPIGEWVLRTACRQAKVWQESGIGRIRVAVNLSAVQFKDEKLVPGILAILTETRLPPELLELEMTESTLMDSCDATISRLEDLKRAGIHLSIDDFGTGYSSMSYLKRFPVDTLKIDKSFLRGLPSDAQNAAITQAIIAMARSLKLFVIAEGVETSEQAVLLQQFGCDCMQGYHFGYPVPSSQATLLLQHDAETSALAPSCVSQAVGSEAPEAAVGALD